MHSLIGVLFGIFISQVVLQKVRRLSRKNCRLEEKNLSAVYLDKLRGGGGYFFSIEFTACWIRNSIVFRCSESGAV
jgi:hypothetical protein